MFGYAVIIMNKMDILLVHTMHKHSVMNSSYCYNSNTFAFVYFCAGKSYGVEVVWMDSTTDEADLWQRMLQSDGEWVEDVLPLRMFVMAKSMSN